jgi:hypothetical protein
MQPSSDLAGRAKRAVQAMATAVGPFVPVSLYIVGIWGCQYLSTVPPSDSGGALSLWDSILSFLGAFFGVAPKSDPFLAILTGVNLVTVCYGLWYYTDERKLLGRWPAVLAFGFALLLLFQASQGAKITSVILHELGVARDSADHATYVAIANVYREFAVAFFVTTFFAIVDYHKSKRLLSADERARLYFQSLYISTPTLIALVVAMFFHRTAEYMAQPLHSQSVAYLAGVTALIIVLSNLTFALFCMPSYASKLQFELKD